MERSFRFVLILTFIGSGFSCLAYLMTGCMLPMMQDMYASGQLAIPENMRALYDAGFERLAAMPRHFFFELALCYALSLSGAILMWRFRWSGFHLYTVAQIVILLLPPLVLGSGYFGVGDAMLTLLFILFYFFGLRRIQAEMEPIVQEPPQLPDDEDDDDEEEDDE